MLITSNFDSGNIKVISAASPDSIKLAINKDNQSDYYQWFHFKLHCSPFVEHKIHIQDLAKSAYPDGWKGYQALASYDRTEWFRVDTEFDGDTLQINFTPEFDSVYFAYFVPYSYERHLDLIANAQMSFDCRHELLGLTLDQRELNMLVLGNEDGMEDSKGRKNIIWI